MLRDKIRRAVAAGRRSFGLTATTDVDTDRFQALADEKTIDFGLLDEDSQKQIIHRLLTKPGDRHRLIHENPFLNAIADTIKTADISANKRIVKEKFNEAVCGAQLMAAYERVARPVVHRLDKKRLLTRFFSPDLFSLLQWEDYEDH